MRDTTNIDELKDEYDHIVEGLQKFGFTEYQARTYTALVAHGVADADTISSTSDLPRTSVYKALDSLHEIGYIVITEGRPRVYRPAEPLEVKSRLSREIDNLFGRLNTIYEVLSEKGEPQLIYTINGKDKVLDKIGELLKKTQDDIVISSPNFSKILKNLENEFRSAKKRDVDITIITSPGERVIDGAEVERRERLIATDMISDGKRALLASPGFEACGYTENPSLSKHLVNFMDILMKRSD
ncbi:MAG: TrmB family transcriptional regulator [Thermoplasmata archaeon]